MESSKEAPAKVVIAPVSDDGLDMIAALHRQCFGDGFMGFMGATYLRRVYGFMVGDRESVILGATENGKMVGFAAGVTNRREFYRRFRKQCGLGVLLDAIRVSITRPTCLPRVSRLVRRSRGTVTYSEPAFLLAIGIHPDRRGQGIAGHLLDTFGDALRAKGVGAFALTTEASENESANRFYHKCGLELVRTFQPPDREGQLNEYRCVLSGDSR